MSQAASPAQTLPIAGSDETALIRVDGDGGAREGYRRMPRSDARLNEDSVADATTDTVAIDAPRNAWQARRLAVLSR